MRIPFRNKPLGLLSKLYNLYCGIAESFGHSEATATCGNRLTHQRGNYVQYFEGIHSIIIRIYEEYGGVKDMPKSTTFVYMW